MSKAAPDGAAGELFATNAMKAFLQIGSVVLLIWMCYSIIAPFLSLVAWGLIIAVALHPTHLRFAALLGGHEGRSATLLVVIGLALLALPLWLSLDNGIDSARQVATGLRDGTLAIPAPRDSVAEWPLVGERIHALWAAASENLQETLRQFDAQLAAVGEAVLRNLGSGVLGVLKFLGSIIVAGIFLVSGRGGYRLARAVATSVSPHRGPELVNVAIDTIRSVTKGVLGVAVVQAMLALIGLVAMDVPGAGIWAAIVLVLAVLQLPPWIVLVPVSIWVFSVAELVPAAVFLVYSMIVSASDLVLKPWFLGRGVNLPMPVILVGAIGGAISMGVIGLFVGAVTLAIAYELTLAWIYPEDEAEFTGTDETDDSGNAA